MSAVRGGVSSWELQVHGYRGGKIIRKPTNSTSMWDQAVLVPTMRCPLIDVVIVTSPINRTCSIINLGLRAGKRRFLFFSNPCFSVNSASG
jgi:hypothetical protein